MLSKTSLKSFLISEKKKNSYKKSINETKNPVKERTRNKIFMFIFNEKNRKIICATKVSCLAIFGSSRRSKGIGELFQLAVFWVHLEGENSVGF